MSLVQMLGGSFAHLAHLATAAASATTTTAAATSEGTSALAPPLSIGSVLWRLVASLSFMGGVIALGLWMVRRRGSLGLSKHVPRGQMLVAERSSLSRAASIALVQVGHRRLLVGSTEQGVALLADVTDDFEDPGALGTDHAEIERGSIGPAFDSALSQARRLLLQRDPRSTRDVVA